MIKENRKMKAVTQELMKTRTCTGVKEEPLRHRKTIQLQQQMDEDERNYRQRTLGRQTMTETATRKSVDKHTTQMITDGAFPQHAHKPASCSGWYGAKWPPSADGRWYRWDSERSWGPGR